MPFVIGEEIDVKGVNWLNFIKLAGVELVLGSHVRKGEPVLTSNFHGIAWSLQRMPNHAEAFGPAANNELENRFQL